MAKKKSECNHTLDPIKLHNSAQHREHESDMDSLLAMLQKDGNGAKVHRGMMKKKN